MDSSDRRFTQEEETLLLQNDNYYERFNMMRGLKYVLLAASSLLLASTPVTQTAQAQVTVGIGVAPVCPYGYYDYAPYNCAPYGYYGPEWFNGGVFIGAGPWFHGPHGFYGHVNHAYDPHFGYHGPFPNRGEAFHEPADHWHGFQATHSRDGQGHERGR